MHTRIMKFKIKNIIVSDDFIFVKLAKEFIIKNLMKIN